MDLNHRGPKAEGLQPPRFNRSRTHPMSKIIWRRAWESDPDALAERHLSGVVAYQLAVLSAPVTNRANTMIDVMRIGWNN